MYIMPHGGACCGMFHLVGLRDLRHLTRSAKIARIKREIDRHILPSNSGRVVEITATNRQFEADLDLIDVLRITGFVNVSSFRNSNSGNTVHVFHKMVNGCDRTPCAPLRIRRIPFLKYVTRLFRR